MLNRSHIATDPFKRQLDSTPTGEPAPMVYIENTKSTTQVIRPGFGHHSVVVSWMTGRVGICLSTLEVNPYAINKSITQEIKTSQRHEFHLTHTEDSVDCVLVLPIDCVTVQVTGFLSSDKTSTTFSIVMILTPPVVETAPVVADPPPRRVVEDEAPRRRERSRSRERENTYMTREDSKVYINKRLLPTVIYGDSRGLPRSAHDKDKFIPTAYYRKDDIDEYLQKRIKEIEKMIIELP